MLFRLGIFRGIFASGKAVIVVLAGMCSLLPLNVLAQTSESRLSLPALVEQEPSTSQQAQVQVKGQLRLEGMDYLTPLVESPHLTYSQLLSARLYVHREAANWQMATDLAAGTFFSRAQSNLFVNEAYVARQFPYLSVYGGRKKMPWSEIDHRWQLGLWQPRQALDMLRPEEQGLTGIFLDHSTDDLQVMAFVTPIFIPSMGPEVRQEGGSLVSDSRWYRSPTSSYAFNDRINSISYELTIPETEKLVMNPGSAAMLRWGNKEQGTWFLASVGYKPVNELILKRQIFKAIASDKVDVKVSPDVTYHTLTSVDLGYSFESSRLTFSYLQDSPDVKIPETDWAIQRIRPLSAYAVAWDSNWDLLPTRPLSLQLGYLRVEGGGIEDITSNGQVDDITLFDQRMKFMNAVSAQVEGQVARLFKRPLITRFKHLYDFVQKGSLVTAELSYYPGHQWAVLAGIDVLSVQDEETQPSSFLNQFRANDRIYGGMTYVF